LRICTRVERLLLLPSTALVKDFDLSLQGVLSLPASRESSASLRSQFGLPANGVLFCSFGEAYKLDANILAIWTRILQRTPNSTLWLPRYNALAEEVHTYTHTHTHTHTQTHTHTHTSSMAPAPVSLYLCLSPYLCLSIYVSLSSSICVSLSVHPRRQV
jgi:hypothetical protein